MNGETGPLLFAGAIFGAAANLLLLLALGILPPHHSQACFISQPAYAGTVRTGTWHLTLRTGQSVTLPDGDSARCTDHGLEIS